MYLKEPFFQGVQFIYLFIFSSSEVFITASVALGNLQQLAVMANALTAFSFL